MEGKKPPFVMNIDFYLLWLALCWITYPPLFISYVYIAPGGAIHLFLLVTSIGFSLIPGLLWPLQNRKLKSMTLEPTFKFRTTWRLAVILIILVSVILSMYLTEIWFYTI